MPDDLVISTAEFTAYGDSWKPECWRWLGLTFHWHAFHKDGEEAANTANDLLFGIWRILRAQAGWLERRVEHLDSEKLAGDVSVCRDRIFDVKLDLSSQKKEITDALEDVARTQKRLNEQTRYVEDVVNQASEKIGDQKREILEKLDGLKEELIRECVAEVEKKIGNIEKAVMENNRFLKRFQEEENLGYKQSDIAALIKDIRVPGLEQLVRKEDLNDLKKKIDPSTLVRRMDLKQEIILGKLEEQQKMLKGFDMEKMEILFKNANGEIEEIIKEMSGKVDMLSMDANVAEDLAKAKEHLNKAAQYISLV